jgi:hypothetical protein
MRVPARPVDHGLAGLVDEHLSISARAESTWLSFSKMLLVKCWFELCHICALLAGVSHSEAGVCVVLDVVHRVVQSDVSKKRRRQTAYARWAAPYLPIIACQNPIEQRHGWDWLLWYSQRLTARLGAVRKSA